MPMACVMQGCCTQCSVSLVCTKAHHLVYQTDLAYTLRIDVEHSRCICICREAGQGLAGFVGTSG